MTKIVQWNCKGLKARHEEVQLLMNRHQPSCTCLQEVMLENSKYSLEREYEFSATTPWVRETREGLQLKLKKNNTQETKHKNNHPCANSGGLPDRKGKEESMLYIFTLNRPGDRRIYERSPGADLTPMILNQFSVEIC